MGGDEGAVLETRQLDRLRPFRLIAAETRAALQSGVGRERPLRMVGEYIETEGWFDGLRALCVPVRRAYLAEDKASLLNACDVLADAASPVAREQAGRIRAEYGRILRDLETGLTLGGRRVTHGELFRKWLDAAVFFDAVDKRRPYQELLETMGRAVEGIAADITREIASQVIALDDLITGVAPPSPP
jgi:hypothetical protein